MNELPQRTLKYLFAQSIGTHSNSKNFHFGGLYQKVREGAKAKLCNDTDRSAISCWNAQFSLFLRHLLRHHDDHDVLNPHYGDNITEKKSWFCNRDKCKLD